MRKPQKLNESRRLKDGTAHHTVVYVDKHHSSYGMAIDARIYGMDLKLLRKAYHRLGRYLDWLEYMHKNHNCCKPTE